jgi:hypothetical protein
MFLNRKSHITNPIDTLTTARLVAQAITPADFPDIHRLHSDLLVIKTLSADGNPLSEEGKPYWESVK